MVSHAFCLAHAAWQAFGENLDVARPPAAMMHDVVEDGSAAVAGYYHSLRLLRKRFGAPIAAMVGEVTDARECRPKGRAKRIKPSKHRACARCAPRTTSGRYTTMRIRPTDARTPYTVAGIITKLGRHAHDLQRIRTRSRTASRAGGVTAAFGSTGLSACAAPSCGRCREARIGRSCFTASTRSTKTSSKLPASMMEGMLTLVDNALDASDRYMTQNLAILASEYALSAAEERH